MIYINYVNIFINYDRIIKTMHDIMVFGAIETIKLLFFLQKSILLQKWYVFVQNHARINNK